MAKDTAPRVIRKMAAESILLDRLHCSDSFGFFLLAILAGFFGTIYAFIDNRSCYRYDAQAAVDQKYYAAVVHEREIGLCSCPFPDDVLSLFVCPS